MNADHADVIQLYLRQASDVARLPFDKEVRNATGARNRAGPARRRRAGGGVS